MAMRILRFMLAACGVALMAVPALAQSAAPSSWCAQYEEIGRNCGFSMQQCMATQIGNGGYCEPNPLATLPTPPAEPVRRPRRAKKAS
jgi:hypothetical protein